MWVVVSRTLLISDANIIIDMAVGGLLEPMFALDYEFATPDLLYHAELQDQHAYLPEMGLQIRELDGASVQQLLQLNQQYMTTGVSSYDLSALTLAIQEQAPLLTGDRMLVQVCIEQNVEVHGTLWITEQILVSGIKTTDEISVAYQSMKDDGSRLPWDETKKQLQRHRK